MICHQLKVIQGLEFIPTLDFRNKQENMTCPGHPTLFNVIFLINLCISDAREYLRVLREDNVRSSDDVVDIYDAFIRDCNPNDLGDERWMILEQVVVAGFDTHRIDIVDICLRELSTMFDTESSLRMRRLFAMKMEMQEEFEAALEILNSIIDEDDSNSQARKRKIAILKVGSSLSK